MSLLMILFGTMSLISSGSSDDDDNPFKRKYKDPFDRGYFTGRSLGDQTGLLDALNNHLERPMYKPLPAPTQAQKDYTEGFAIGWNETYLNAYAEMIKKKLKFSLDRP